MEPLLHEWFDALANTLTNTLRSISSSIVATIAIILFFAIIAIVIYLHDTKRSIASVAKLTLPLILLGAIWAASVLAALHFAFFFVSRLDPQLIRDLLRFHELLWPLDRTETITVIIVFISLIFAVIVLIVIFSIVLHFHDPKSASLTKLTLLQILLGAIVASPALYFAVFFVSRLYQLIPELLRFIELELIPELLRFIELLRSMDRTEARTVIVVFIFLIVTSWISAHYMEKLFLIFEESWQIAPKDDAPGKPALPAANQDKDALRQAWNPGVGRGNEGISQVADRISTAMGKAVTEENMSSFRRAVGNPVVFVLLYILLMLPTYILPWLGSNSAFFYATGVAVQEMNPAFWMHLIVWLALIVLAYARGSVINQGWLVILPIIGAVFDLVPGINWIPLIPTILNIVCVICGVALRPRPIVA